MITCLTETISVLYYNLLLHGYATTKSESKSIKCNVRKRVICIKTKVQPVHKTRPTSSLRFCQRPHGLSSKISDSSSLSSSSSSVAAVAGGCDTMDTGGDTEDGAPWAAGAAATDSGFASWADSGACLLSPSDILFSPLCCQARQPAVWFTELKKMKIKIT